MPIHGLYGGLFVLFGDCQGNEPAFLFGDRATFVSPGEEFDEKFLCRGVASDDKGSCGMFVLDDVVSPINRERRCVVLLKFVLGLVCVQQIFFVGIEGGIGERFVEIGLEDGFGCLRIAASYPKAVSDVVFIVNVSFEAEFIAVSPGDDS